MHLRVIRVSKSLHLIVSFLLSFGNIMPQAGDYRTFTSLDLPISFELISCCRQVFHIERGT